VYLHKKVKGYSVKKSEIGSDIFFKNKLVAQSFRKHELYKFLELQSINWKKHLSKKLLPDDAIYVIKENTLFIIEVKYQQVEGSVDEKLQTCDFKLKQYKKLFSELNYEIKYIYVLSKWFKNDKYKDVLDYIISVNCKYYFEYLPLHELGLPVPGR
ncbi:MAG: PD-(D/E)XK nuclease superfamily protein, partial [Patescibacteria group bacterium]